MSIRGLNKDKMPKYSLYEKISKLTGDYVADIITVKIYISEYKKAENKYFNDLEKEVLSGIKNKKDKEDLKKILKSIKK